MQEKNRNSILKSSQDDVGHLALNQKKTEKRFMCITKYSDTVNIENAEYVPKMCLFAIINVDTNNAGELKSQT